jgi:hypothetical protein
MLIFNELNFHLAPEQQNFAMLRCVVLLSCRLRYRALNAKWRYFRKMLIVPKLQAFSFWNLAGVFLRLFHVNFSITTFQLNQWFWRNLIQFLRFIKTSAILWFSFTTRWKTHHNLFIHQKSCLNFFSTVELIFLQNKLLNYLISQFKLKLALLCFVIFAL